MGGGGDFLLFFASFFFVFFIEKGNAKHPESLDKANTELNLICESIVKNNRIFLV